MSIFSVRRNISLGFGAGVAMLVTIGVIAHRSLDSLVADEALIAHTHQVLEGLEVTLSHITEAESAKRGFAITGDERFLEDYPAAEGTIARTVERLRQLTISKPDQQAWLNRLDSLIKKKISGRQELIDLRRSAGTGAGPKVYAPLEGKRLMDDIRQIIHEMIARGEALLTERTQQAEISARTSERTILVGSLLACIIVLFALFFMNRQVVPRQRAGSAVHEDQEHLKAIPDNSAAVILLKDTERRFLRINWQFQRSMKSPAKDTQDKTGDVLCTPVSRKVPARDTTSRIGDAATIATEITGRRDAEEALRRARDELEIRVQQRTAQLAAANESLNALASVLSRSNRELQEFADVASHDLQEPLRKILAFGGRLRDRLGDTLLADDRDCLARMLSSTQRMQRLIDDLLSFARITTKARPFARVDLKRVAEETLSDLEARVAQTSGRVEIGNLPVIEADETQMHQLLQNLIGNALKFHRPDTPPLVRVRGRWSPDEKASPEGCPPESASCQIEVEDNGIGFDEVYLDRIFKPFQRLHARAEGYEGTGIGLAICRKIAERHGGSITARSKPGRGATFVVTLLMSQTKHQDEGDMQWKGTESGRDSEPSWPTKTLTTSC